MSIIVLKRDFRIILLRNNEEIKYFGSYPTPLKANKEFIRLIKENEKDVLFPMRYINTNKIKKVDYKLVILVRNGKGHDIVPVRDDFGNYIENNIINNDEWSVYDMHPYNIEETFWVWGYHPKHQRKNALFIYENKIVPKATSKYDFINVVFFKNKLLFESYNGMDMVICKNNDDCIRLYNLIESLSKKDKLKYIMFSGNVDTRKWTDQRVWVNKILKLTGWTSIKKVLRPTTRP